MMFGPYCEVRKASDNSGYKIVRLKDGQTLKYVRGSANGVGGNISAYEYLKPYADMFNEAYEIGKSSN